jgi:multidrug efflux pump subunit AcrB
VQIVGGLERAINIWADADAVAAYRLPISRVADALARQNADVRGAT